MSPPRAPLERQLHFVTGKGGVGKSVVSVGLALSWRARGERVLLVQVNAKDSHSAVLGVPAIGPEVNEVEPGFFVVNTTPAVAMKEYALMTLKFEAVYQAVFENRLTRAFLRFVPSLAELTMLGKIWFHAEERDDRGRARFDRIVVDCPSTGHGLKLLRTAQVIRDASRTGPMYDKTKLMAEVLEDPARTAAHVVTLAEELPVNETLDLIAQLKDTGVAPTGLIVENQVLPRLFDARVGSALDRARAHVQGDKSVDDSTRLVLEVGSRRRHREADEGAQRHRLQALGLPWVALPHQLTPRFTREHALALGERILQPPPPKAPHEPAPSTRNPS